MTLHIRPPTAFDHSAMAQLLNEIIQIGGTTAYTSEISANDLKDKIAKNRNLSAWHIATNDREDCLGFQWIAPHPDLPSTACDIATFVRSGQTGIGIGSRLFDTTRRAALSLGYKWINATIRSDNDSGLTYYQSRGFRTYDTLENQMLANGMRVSKTLKWYDLTD